MIVYLARAIQAFVMYCVNGTSRSSLLIDSMIYSSPLFVLGTTIDSRHTSVMRKLTQREFYRQLVVSLCHSILVRPAATQQHADNTLERLRGHHYSERGKKRRDCTCAAVVAQERKGTSQIVFGKCSGHPPLCIDSCFMAYQTQALF